MTILHSIQQEFASGLPDATQLARWLVRLVAALVLGAAVGFNRERTGKPAGLRMHMLVSLGTALFVLAAQEAGIKLDELSRVVQGIATGIGFLGAGAILKISARGEIKGLTTAAGIWVTAAVGIACGFGVLGGALLAVFLTWLTLTAMDSFSKRLAPGDPHYHLDGAEAKNDAEV